MNSQTPAEGILKINDWGSSRVYQVVCSCNNPDHNHTVWVEADESGVNVIIYTTNTSKFWTKNRWRQIWELLTTGQVEQEVGIVMSEQQTLNYAKSLTRAIEDVKKFKAERRNLDG